MGMEKEQPTTSTEIKKPFTKSQLNNLQVIVGNENFLFTKSFSEKVNSVVSPWVRLPDGSFESGFEIDENKLFRVQNFKSKLEISRYTVGDKKIRVDCVSKFPTEFFPETGESGWIHFLSNVRETNDQRTIEIDDRMVIERIEPIGIDLKQTSKVEFVTKNLKVFPIFFVQGFALTVIDREKAVLWTTVQDFSKSYCGTTNRLDLNNLIHNILPVFPVFTININDKKSAVFLKIDGLKPFMNKIEFQKGLIRLEYSFANPTDLHVCVIGKCEE